MAAAATRGHVPWVPLRSPTRNTSNSEVTFRPRITFGHPNDEVAVDQSRPEHDRNSSIQMDNNGLQELVVAHRGTPMVHPPNFTPHMVNSMRRKLRFFFMNPIEKWKARRQFPFKLLLQILKIIIVTVQLCMFGNARYSHMNFYDDNRIALCNLFLKDWDSTYEVESYPPSQGPYAIYTKDEFFLHLDHIVSRYGTIHETAIGSYDYMHENLTQSPLTICKTFYKTAEIWGFNESFIFDPSPIEQCLDIVPEVPIQNGTIPEHYFNSRQYFADHNFTIIFDRLIKLEVKFSLKYVLLKALDTVDTPDCYQLDVKVLFDDQDHDGQASIILDMIPFMLDCVGGVHIGSCDELTCRGNKKLYIRGEPYGDAKNVLDLALITLLNCIVIFICILSFILCSRALIRAQVLKYEAVIFFRDYFGKQLTVNDTFEFINIWYIMIIINDVLIIVGSVLKIQIENKLGDGDYYNLCSVCLGTGSILVWFGVLRYLGFFQKYNILLVTLRKALPDVLRFLLCTGLMYGGFVFCGWLIFGPYHIKFRSLSSTSECLFSLVNGDDMYATFTILKSKTGIVWWFSRAYIYIFTSLFIYIVLSLFIAVIMDTYETIKQMSYEQRFHIKGDLLEFAFECQDDINSGVFRQESVNPWAHFKRFCSTCCSRSNRDENRPLLFGGK